MPESTFYLEAPDRKRIFVRAWLPQEPAPPRAAVQIAHGMAEHSARYRCFAVALNQAGIAVYAHDHRGHGMTEEDPCRRGHFADQDGWSTALQDLHLLTGRIRQAHPQVPIMLLGHSLGSFLARRHIQLHGDELAGVMLSGTGGDPGIAGKLGLTLANAVIRMRGSGYRSKLLDRLIFGKYNQDFQPNRTAFDWLSRDEDEVDRYVEDESCGFLCTAGFIRDMIGGIVELHKPDNLRTIPKELPVYLFSGDKDPLGRRGQAVREAAKQYKRLGVGDVELKLYKDGRHEMLNEVNREEVYRDVIRWIESKS